MTKCLSTPFWLSLAAMASVGEWLISIPQHQMLKSIRRMPMITFINAIGDRLEEGDQISIGAESTAGKAVSGITYRLAR